MGMIIMAHAEEAFKEYFLPALNNSDYKIILDDSLFALGANIEILLEVVGNEWRFVESVRYKITQGAAGNAYGKRLKNNDVYTLTSANNRKVSLIIVETERAFQIFRKLDISGMTQIDIGSYQSNHIVFNFQGYISRNHAIIQRSQAGWVLYDVSSNGTFIGNRRVREARELRFGDCISIFGLRMVFLGTVLAVCNHFGDTVVQVNGIREYYLPYVQNAGKRKHEEDTPRFFKRSPRNIQALCCDSIEIDAPPTVRTVREKPLMMVIGPSFTMAIPMLLGSGLAILSTRMSGGSSSVYMFTGLITALGSAAIGVFWALTNIRYNKRVEKEDQELRYNAYGKYLIEIADTLKGLYETNRRILNERYFSSEICCQFDENTSALWNRNLNHEDFLAVRLGLGSMPFQVDIQIPKKKFEMAADELRDKPQQLKESYQTLYQIPVCIDLQEKNLVGIVGGRGKQGAIQIVHDIVAQIAVNNCYTDVKMAFLYEKKSANDEKNWGFARWLPHVWTEDKKIRLIAEDKKEAGDIAYELAHIIKQRLETQEHEKTKVKPHYVLFVESPHLLEGEILAKYALNPKPEYGLTTVIMVERYDDLPNSCEDIIQNDGTVAQLYHVAESMEDAKNIEFDRINPTMLEQLARRLSGIEVNESESRGEVPANLDFLEMYGIRKLEELNVTERWTKNRSYDSMKALIGKKGGGIDCYLDIHEKFHGPHGLVAGTTGSGKSETLQTYILSLAVNFSPYDIGFFIIDFKGGGMANLFSGLPHLIGQISNLSGNQVRRAMISIKSEINRRQRLFTENSVNNINLYTRLYKNGETAVAIPHLFIIIDEFAELKREEPEFMKELISVAQVGRSLGVHLILSTQKPAGTVDDNIWSNSKFRLCLRVQDRQDSNDMLHKPDAAYITQAGRGYLQVGNDEIYELFQSGYSGAAYDEDVANNKGNIATMLTSSGKTAVVGNKLKKIKKEKKRRDWLLCLEKVLTDITQKQGYTLDDLASDEDVMDTLAEQIFSVIRDAGYHFEDTGSNRKRIQEYSDMLLMVEGMSEVQGVDFLCDYADKMRKKLPEVKDTTQLEAVVEYLAEVAKQNNYVQNMALWLPVLPNMLCLQQLSGFEDVQYRDGRWPKQSSRWSLDVMVGLYDDPENQAQGPFIVNLSDNGHHAVCGTVVTGKSTFLQTFVYAMIQKYSPQWVNLYLLDFSSNMLSCFEKAPHVGGVICHEEQEKTKRFFHMLNSMLEERKNLLKGGNYSQYVHKNGISIPAVVVVIDNYATFREKTDNKYEDIIIRLSREGVGNGIFLMISSAGFGAAEIPGRIGDNIRTVIALEMGDRFKFAEVMRVTRVETLPEADVKGRGIAWVSESILEFQTAVAVNADNDYERSRMIEEECVNMDQMWEGDRAREIPHIPEKPLLSLFAQSRDYMEMSQTSNLLPVAYRMDDASCYGIDLSHTYAYMITGKARTGKTNFLKTIIYAAAQKKGKICIIENVKNELQKLADTVGASYVSTDQEIFNFFKATVDIFKKRNAKKNKMLGAGAEDYEIFEAMQEEAPIFIFVADMVAFVQGIYRKLENGSSMSGYLETIAEKGRLHHIYFFGCIDTDEVSKVLGLKAYTAFTGHKEGVHLGGNVASQKIFSFSNIPFTEQNKGMKQGLGLVASVEDTSIAETIVIPLAKGV